MARTPMLNAAKESRMSSSTSPPAPTTDRRRARSSLVSTSSESPIPSQMQMHDEEEHSEKETPTYKSEQANKTAKRVTWLDRQWGNSSWIPADVRKAQPNKAPIAGETIRYLVKITKIAQRENVALASIWDNNSPHNFLRRAVNQGNNPPRLLSNMAAQVYKDWNKRTGELGASDNVSDVEPSDDSEDEPTKSKLEASDSESELEAGEKTKANAAPPISVKRPNPSTFTHQSPSPIKPNFFAKRSTSMPVSTRPSPAASASTQLSEQGQLGQLSSKRKNDDETLVNAPPSKRPELSKRQGWEDQAHTKAAALLQQLTEDTRLTSDSLEILSKVLVAPHPLVQGGKVNLIDPLWFKFNSKNPPDRTTKFSNCNMVCFPIHHSNPKHWTLAVIYITADSMTLRHHDSMPDLGGERYNLVCNRFKDWKEHHGFKHALTFKRIETCTQQRDTMNCGIHVLSCLRNELAGKQCTESVSPAQEREFLIQCMKDVDHDATALSDTDHDIIREFNKLLVAHKKRVDTEEQNKIWAEIGETTMEALTAQSKDAEAQRLLISVDLSQAEKAVEKLVIQHDTLVGAFKSVTRALDSEGITPNTAHPNNLSKHADMSQKELIAIRSKVVEEFLASGFCEASDIAKSDLHNQVHGLSERIREAHEEVWRKKTELNRAESLVKRITCKREAKEAVMRMMQQGQEGLFSS
ncbi:hypothetical protein QYS62_006671 [Fusarium acuminatum]|uniref:Ubiquitin-like protease family profile domain-containing protein n=1 Tax=Fusarium acuminatum TaxID=5515 RepID=A0ABZ2X0J1_9HYPO